MREASFIIPTVDKEGFLSDSHVIDACGALVDAFGGVTKTYGTGYWRDDSGNLIKEPVAILTVAWEGEKDITFGAIAAKCAADLDQDALYIKWPSGNVDILSRSQYLKFLRSE